MATNSGSTFLGNGGILTIEVLSSTDWHFELSGDTSWLKIVGGDSDTHINGRGNSAITLSANTYSDINNDIDHVCYGVCNLIDNDSFSDYVKIIQHSNYFYLNDYDTSHKTFYVRGFSSEYDNLIKLITDKTLSDITIAEDYVSENIIDTYEITQDGYFKFKTLNGAVSSEKISEVYFKIGSNAICSFELIQNEIQKSNLIVFTDTTELTENVHIDFEGIGGSFEFIIPSYFNQESGVSNDVYFDELSEKSGVVRIYTEGGSYDNVDGLFYVMVINQLGETVYNGRIDAFNQVDTTRSFNDFVNCTTYKFYNV